MGEPFDQARYDRVVDVCSLRADLSILQYGDQAEVSAFQTNRGVSHTDTDWRAGSKSIRGTEAANQPGKSGLFQQGHFPP